MLCSGAILAMAPTMTEWPDYTPKWQRGNPNTYIDSVLFPKVFTDKSYSYRVIIDGKDKGIRSASPVQKDGSQEVNLLEFNAGYGVIQSAKIRVYVVDDETGNQYLVAGWN